MNKLLIGLLLVAVAVVLYYRMNPQEGFEDAVASVNSQNYVNVPTENQLKWQVPENYMSSQGTVPSDSNANADKFKKFEKSNLPACDESSQFKAEDLLPKDESSTLWAQMNPSGSGSLEGRNFLQAGYHLGINTVGQSLKNANYQLRSDPPNPKMVVSPWMQSTIDPDVRRCFEIS